RWRSPRSSGSPSSACCCTAPSGSPRAAGRRGRRPPDVPRPPGGASMKRLVLATCAVTLVLGLALGGPSAQPVQKFVFALNWFAVGDHAAYWVALQRGYYKSKTLDVELVNSKGSGDSIAKVDTGRADAGLADAVV